MQQELYRKELDKIFNGFANQLESPQKLKLELDLYKKLWNFFLAGDSYYFIFNYHTLKCDFISKEAEAIHECKLADVDLVALTTQIHPDDYPYFLSIGKRIEKFFLESPKEKIIKYKARFDVRYPKKDKSYMRLLYQGIIIEHNEQGRPLRSLGVHSDISYLKKEGKPTLSFLGMDGELSYINVDLENNYHNEKDDFTTREKDILKLLIEGKLSKEIAGFLHISKQTVDKHRKNMLHKKNLVNTTELVGKAITHGWI